MGARKTPGQKGVPATENPGKNHSTARKSLGSSKENIKNTPSKKSVALASDLSPLEKWKVSRAKAIGNPDWYIYDKFIKKIVGELNQHLSKSRQISNYQPLDWKLIKAMIWTETGATAAAWKTRTMQIGNPRDRGIEEVTIPARPRKYNLIIPVTWSNYLINKSALIKSNPEYNIRAGISLLMIKMSEKEKDRAVYDNEIRDNIPYEVTRGDRGYSTIAPKIGTTAGVLASINGNKTIHPGDRLEYRKAHIEQYIPGWYLFTPENIQIQYNGDPKKATTSKPGDGNYAEKIKYVYSLIVADENENN